MVHETPDQYWQFMTEIAAPVVAGLTKADAATRERIGTETLEVARRSMRDGTVQMLFDRDGDRRHAVGTYRIALNSVRHSECVRPLAGCH